MTLTVPTVIDGYQNVISSDNYIVSNIHIQSDNHTAKTADNTEATLSGIIFVDTRHSSPALDYTALQETAQAAGGVMTCTVTDKRGRTSRPYTIVTIDGLPDDEDGLHHWELGVT